MARDNSRQILIGGACGRIDTGEVDVAVGNTTVAIYTPLSYVVMGAGHLVTGKTLGVVTAGAVTNGSVNVTVASVTSTTDKLQYQLVGY